MEDEGEMFISDTTDLAQLFPVKFVISRVIINPVTSSCFCVYNCKGTKCKEHKYFCSGVDLTKIKNLP